MAIPTKRHENTTVSYLDLAEIKALLAAPDQTTWLGRRDHALLALMIQTGVRVSELTGLRVSRLHLGTGAHIQILGKGRKRRSTTLTREIAEVVAPLAARAPTPEPDDPLFCTRQGRQTWPIHDRRLDHKARYDRDRQLPVTDPPSTSPRTRCGTPTGCCSAPTASTSQRSRCGSDIKALRPPTSTNTPTPRSKKKHRPHRPCTAPSPADTAHPTRSWPSSKASEYVERITAGKCS